MLRLLPLVLFCGCKVTDAPADLESLVVYGFENFSEDDERPLAEVATNLPPLLDQHSEDLEDGVRVGNLTAVHLAAAGIEADITDIVGALGLAHYSHDLDAVTEVLSAEDKADRFDNYESYEIVDSTDRPCFLAHECGTLVQTVHEVAEAGILGTAEREYDIEYRWVELEEGRPALIIRTLSPDPVDISSTFANIFQQYAFVVLYEDAGLAVRAETFWVDAEIIGLDVPDNFAVGQAVRSMGQQAERIDANIDGE